MNTHEAVVKREVRRKIYAVSRYWYEGEFEIYDISETTETETLWTGDLDSPILKENDELYLDHLDEIIIIKRVIRSTDNKYVYFAKSRLIEDELSKESLARAKVEKERKETEEKGKIALAESVEQTSWIQKLFKKK